MKAAAILLAAGAGERLASDVPKAFVELDGRPLFLHALEHTRTCPAIESIVVVVPEAWVGRATALVGGHAAVVAGGVTRQASVAAGLAALGGRSDVDAVVCHDAARPRAGVALFDRVLGALERADGAIPAVPVADTLKRVADGTVVETIDREGLVAVQTPQAFRRGALEEAHARAALEGAAGTDDAALLERLGRTVVVVDGDPANIKVTGPDDLRMVRALANG